MPVKAWLCDILDYVVFFIFSPIIVPRLIQRRWRLYWTVQGDLGEVWTRVCDIWQAHDRVYGAASGPELAPGWGHLVAVELGRRRKDAEPLLMAALVKARPVVAVYAFTALLRVRPYRREDLPPGAFMRTDSCEHTLGCFIREQRVSDYFEGYFRLKAAMDAGELSYRELAP